MIHLHVFELDLKEIFLEHTWLKIAVEMSTSNISVNILGMFSKVNCVKKYRMLS